MISTLALVMALAAPDKETGVRSKDPPLLVEPAPPVVMPTPPVVRTHPYPAPPAPPAPPSPPRFVRGTPARAELARIVSPDDYPAEALRAGEEGIVSFSLLVGPDGRVNNCLIQESSESVWLDNATCRLMTVRARFSPARDLKGEAINAIVNAKIVWRLPDNAGDAWAPALLVREMRSTAAGAVTCLSGWPPRALLPDKCPAGEAAGMAERTRAAGTALEQTIVTTLTPEGMTEAADRPGRGDPFWTAEATFTIGADGRLLECGLVRSQYLGRDRRAGAPPDPCADWRVSGDRLYLPAPDGKAVRKVNVTVRGYAGPLRAPSWPPDPAVVLSLAERDWQSCVRYHSQRQALQAIASNAPEPGAEAVLSVCHEREERLRNALNGTGGAGAASSWSVRREAALRQARETIATTYSEHKND